MKHSKKQTKNAGKARKAPKTRTPVAPAPNDARTPRERDPRLPAAGTVLVRPYKGKDYKVTVLEQGFRWEGEEYRSLSALAARISGAKSINGYLWFHLTGGDATAAKPKGRKPKEKAATQKETPAEPAPVPENATV